jgi:uncharacterized MAPEG superfamily protein
MLAIIFAVLLLTLVQALLPGRYLTAQVGNAAQVGPRDDLPEPTRELSRARRALANLHETLPIFLTLAILSVVFEEQGVLTIAGALLYLVSRTAYVPCYILGLSPWRSLCFLGGLIGIVLVALPLFGHMWN